MAITLDFGSMNESKNSKNSQLAAFTEKFSL
jgi:hypothetical protein